MNCALARIGHRKNLAPPGNEPYSTKRGQRLNPDPAFSPNGKALERSASQNALLAGPSQAPDIIDVNVKGMHDRAMPSAYSISDLSNEFGVTPRTLRFYEEKGLLQPARIGQSRRYSPADRARLILILRGKTLGLSLRESAELIGMYDPASNNRKQIKRLIEKIQARREQLVAQKLELEQMINDLDAWEKRSIDSIKSHSST